MKQEAERYQQFLLQLLDEAKEVDDKNYVAFGGKKGLKDERTRQYTNIVSLPVLKFYQWREIANGPYNIDGFQRAGVASSSTDRRRSIASLAASRRRTSKSFAAKSRISKKICRHSIHFCMQ